MKPSDPLFRPDQRVLSQLTFLNPALLRLPTAVLVVVVWAFLTAVTLTIASLSNSYAANSKEVLTTSFFGMVISFLLYGAAGRAILMSRRFGVSLIAALALACGTILWMVNVLSQYWIGGHETPAHSSILEWPTDYFVRLRYTWMYFTSLFVLQAVIFGLIRLSAVLKTRERQLLETQLAALRFQLNPHFLFNTLNAIATLIAESNNAKAEEMITRLSHFLRTSLSEEPTGLVSLAHELDTMQAYLEIEAVRFGERLAIHYACDGGLADMQVPSLILQPLLENAIKYAVAPSKERVTISIEASATDRDLILVVQDDGNFKTVSSSTASTGVGLRNVSARLEALYGTSGHIEAIRRERGFTAMIRIPLKGAKN